MEYGIVYLLTNPVMPGLVKIGMTAQKDIEKRMRELYTTGVPVPFECQFACKVKKGDVLQWKDDLSVTLSVYTDRTVIFEGKEMAISAVTRDLKGSKWYVAPGSYWLYNERLLSDIYDETYPVEE